MKDLGHCSFALQGLLMFGSAGAQFAPQLLDASLEVGPVAKMVRVVGNRTWSASLMGLASRPAPFTEMPLVYERALGGSAGSVASTGGHGALM